MDKSNKRAFDHLLENLRRDRSLYNTYVNGGVSDRKTRLTVLGLCALSSNHPIDDNPELWGVTSIEAHRIRAYFHNTPIHTQIEELYGNFPGVFEGESKSYLKPYVPNLDKLRIPL